MSLTWVNSTRENCNCVGLAMLLWTGQSHRTKKNSKSRIKHVATFKHLVFIFLQLDCLKNKIKIKLALKLIINELASSDCSVENEHQ